MLIKVHKSYRYVIAICDTELIGKQFEEGKFFLDIRETFYKGEEVDYDKMIELMQNFAREDATFNIIGKESVKAALEAGIIEKEGVSHIAGIPFALVLM